MSPTDVDVVNIVSRIATKALGRFINKALEKSVGFDPNIKLRSLNFHSGDMAHVDISLDMKNEDFEKLMEVLME